MSEELKEEEGRLIDFDEIIRTPLTNYVMSNEDRAELEEAAKVFQQTCKKFNVAGIAGFFSEFRPEGSRTFTSMWLPGELGKVPVEILATHHLLCKGVSESELPMLQFLIDSAWSRIEECHPDVFNPNKIITLN